jgi:hypothetical protein
MPTFILWLEETCSSSSRNRKVKWEEKSLYLTKNARSGYCQPLNIPRIFEGVPMKLAEGHQPKLSSHIPHLNLECSSRVGPFCGLFVEVQVQSLDCNSHTPRCCTVRDQMADTLRIVKGAIRKFPDCYCCNWLGERRWQGRPRSHFCKPVASVCHVRLCSRHTLFLHEWFFDFVFQFCLRWMAKWAVCLNQVLREAQ